MNIYNLNYESKSKILKLLNYWLYLLKISLFKKNHQGFIDVSVALLGDNNFVIEFRCTKYTTPQVSLEPDLGPKTRAFQA